MPVALAASVQYSAWLGFSANQWRAEDYIGFVCKFMLGMGLGFELPVVILTLVKIGVLNYSILSKARRYMIACTSVCGSPPVTWTLPSLSMYTFTSLRTPNSGR